MLNPLPLLKQSVSVLHSWQHIGDWNAWRADNDDCRPDLRRANLSKSDLDGANLSKADLAGANLSGASLRRADLSKADLAGANLSGADLTGAKLSHADLSHADLTLASLGSGDLAGACLRSADLSRAFLSKTEMLATNLSKAKLTGANLSGANLNVADLNRANLVEANLATATLIDADLNQADLTGAWLWETQRDGWSIKGVVCEYVIWDRERKEVTRFDPGGFERVYARKPQIILNFPGGMRPIDLAMLPLVAEKLQLQYPKSRLQIRSIQDTGSSASVTITVEDIADRDAEEFAAEMSELRNELDEAQCQLSAYGQEFSPLLRAASSVVAVKEITKVESTEHLAEISKLQKKLHEAEGQLKVYEQKFMPLFREIAIAPKQGISIGQVTGPVQAGTGDQNNASISYNDLNEIRQIIGDLLENRDQWTAWVITGKQESFEAELTTLKQEVTKKEPDQSAIRAGMESLRNMLESAGGSALYGGSLAALMNLFG